MKYIKGFNGLRCFSIILVIISHLGLSHCFQKGSYLEDNVFFFFSGKAGVNLFFVISGFLITTLILREEAKTGGFNIRLFFARRFLRLVPPIIPFFIAVFLFMKLGYIRDTSIGLLASIFYAFNFVPRTKLTWSPELGHTWSLAVEEQFYVFWAFAVKYLTKKNIFKLLTVILALCVAAYYILPLISLNIKGQEYMLSEVFFIKKLTIPAIGPILIGALVGMLNSLHPGHFIVKYFKQEKSLPVALVIFASPFYTFGFAKPMIILFYAVGTALFLLWIYHNQNSTVVKYLEWKPIKYIGVISYGLYIWQGFFVRNSPLVTPKTWVHEFPANVILTFLVAILSYELFEKRIMAYKKRFQVDIPQKQAQLPTEKEVLTPTTLGKEKV